MSANIFSIASLAERNHRAFVERESRRAAQGPSRLAGMKIIELREELRMPDGTRAWGDWSALTHSPPAPVPHQPKEVHAAPD